MSTKIQKATHQGDLKINGLKISSAVLEDGTRVLVNRSLAMALGIKGSGAYWQKRKEKGAAIPEYLSAKYFTPFISKELEENLSKPLPYINLAGVETDAIPAEYLSDICDVYVQAGKKGAVKNEIATNAYKILMAFSKVGIIALVDEATGYQDVRVKNALQQILDKFLLQEPKTYEITFPLELYKQWFRLNNWEWKPESAQKRPGVIGTWTNKYIYARIAPGLLKEFKILNPKNEKGRREFKHFQFLTDDIGEPKLRDFFGGLLALARVSTDWRKYIQLVERAYPNYVDQLGLDFPLDD